MARTPRQPRKTPRRSPEVVPQGTSGPVRLQKALADAGVASRRHAEEYILAGRVTVDGQVVTELGVKVDPTTQTVAVDGQELEKDKKVYYAVNKPVGVISTNADPEGRPRVIDLLPHSQQRLFPVGRLDESSQGLILVTNDGELANKLCHPRYGVPKVYRVQVAGWPTPEAMASLTSGHDFSEGTFRAHTVKLIRHQGESTFLEVTLKEGHNREIRRLMARIGHKALWLQRIEFGPIRLGKLALGDFRRLSSLEIHHLREAVRGRVSNRVNNPTVSEDSRTEPVAELAPPHATPTRVFEQRKPAAKTRRVSHAAPPAPQSLAKHPERKYGKPGRGRAVARTYTLEAPAKSTAEPTPPSPVSPKARPDKKRPPRTTTKKNAVKSTGRRPSSGPRKSPKR